MSTSGGDAPGPPPSSRRPCRARSTSTRATSWAWTRSTTCRVDRLQDPMYFRSGGTDPGRDGCRVPLPWSGSGPPFGFSPAGARERAVAAAAGPLGRPHGRSPARTIRSRCSTSTDARSRSADPSRVWATARWPGCRPTPNCLSSGRGDQFVNITNLSGAAVALPPHAEILLASADIVDGFLPSDATAWLRPPSPVPADRSRGMRDAVTTPERSPTTDRHHVPGRERLPRHTSKEERKE